MDDTQLQIVISAVNNAQAALDEVSVQLESLGTQASDAAGVMTDSMQEASTSIAGSMTAAEEAAAMAATNAGNAWVTASDQWEEDTQTATAAMEEAWSGVSASAEAVANGTIQSWQSSLAELQAAMAQTTEDMETQFADIEEAGAASANGTFGYFHNLILGLMAERAGGALTGFVTDAVNAPVAGDATDKIQQLTAEIQQQKAAIQTHEAALVNWSGTTVEVNARHVAAVAAIEAERVKIEQLTLQLTPLQAAQKAGADAGQQYAVAVAQLNTDWQAFLATLASGGFIQSLTSYVQEIDKIVTEMQVWADAHPELSTEIMKFIGILGEALTAIGAVTIAMAMGMLIFSSAVGPFVLVAAAIALVTAAVIAFWPQITGVFKEINDSTGLLTVLQDAWQSIVQTFDTNLLPALKNLWTALQPLMPTLQALGVVIGVTLVGAIELMVNMLAGGINMFVQILTAAANLETFFTTVFVTAINKVEQALASLFSSPGFQALTKMGSSIGGFISSVGSAIGGASIPGFATGGIVTSPTLAFVGESGPEAIIPLSAFTGGTSLAGAGGIGGGAGGNIVVNITGGSYLDQGGAQQIAQQLATMIGRQIRLTNFR